MPPKALQELQALMSYETRADRKKALESWARRWVVSLQMEAVIPTGNVAGVAMCKAEMLDRMAEGLADPSMDPIWWGYTDESKTKLRAIVSIVRASPHVEGTPERVNVDMEVD